VFIHKWNEPYPPLPKDGRLSWPSHHHGKVNSLPKTATWRESQLLAAQIVTHHRATGKHDGLRASNSRANFRAVSRDANHYATESPIPVQIPVSAIFLRKSGGISLFPSRAKLSLPEFVRQLLLIALWAAGLSVEDICRCRISALYCTKSVKFSRLYFVKILLLVLHCCCSFVCSLLMRRRYVCASDAICQ